MGSKFSSETLSAPFFGTTLRHLKDVHFLECKVTFLITAVPAIGDVNLELSIKEHFLHSFVWIHSIIHNFQNCAPSPFILHVNNFLHCSKSTSLRKCNYSFLFLDARMIIKCHLHHNATIWTLLFCVFYQATDSKVTKHQKSLFLDGSSWLSKNLV